MSEESRFLSFQGVRIHFRVITPEDPPRMRAAFLSSPLISAFNWRKVVPELTQMGCMSVLIDLPGFGHSTSAMAAPQDTMSRANMCWGILDAVDRESGNPDSTWHLIAHGTACPTLLEMGNLYPDSVRSQTHITPLMTFPDALLKKEPAARWYDENILSEAAFRRLTAYLGGYPLDDFISDRMRSMLARRGGRHNFHRMVHASRTKPENGPGFCPAMVLLGGRDPLLTEGVRAEVLSLLGEAELHELKSAGHLPMETHSKALRDYLRGWLRYIS